MATQIVMDHSGDSRHTFDSSDAHAVSVAEGRFRELTSLGYTAAVRRPTGDTVLAQKFDPGADETIFFPRLVGG